jgi:hypothetical protein
MVICGVDRLTERTSPTCTSNARLERADLTHRDLAGVVEQFQLGPRSKAQDVSYVTGRAVVEFDLAGRRLLTCTLGSR